MKNLYPSSEYEKTWDVIAPSNDIGRVFIRDLKSLTVHHVGNYPTYLDLGLGSFKTKVVEPEEFKKCLRGDPFLTSKDNEK